jgi:hypothetical protein
MSALCLPRGAVAALIAISAFAGLQPATSAPLAQNMSLQGVSFRVRASGEGSIQQLVVEASENGKAFPTIKEQVDGSVNAVEVEDLNSDGRPELVVTVVGAGSGSYGSVLAWSASKGHTLQPITMPALTVQQARGYMGHDRFAVVETSLVRSFPIYRQNDSNANPTGGIRQIDYKMVAGEAGWQFKPVRTADAPAS